MHASQINTTGKLRSSKRNDSSAFSAAFARMCDDPAAAEYARLKSEVLKQAGCNISATTPSKMSDPTPPSSASAKLPTIVSVGKTNQENTADTPNTSTPEAEEKKVRPEKPSRITPHKAIIPPVPRPPQKQKKTNPAPPQKREVHKTRSSSKAIEIRPAIEPPAKRVEQTEIETLRTRISGLNAKIRRLEAENAKLREPGEGKQRENEKVVKCDVNFGEPADDSRRSMFLKDKIAFLQNQIELLKKGLVFHKPIAYSTEYLLNETVGAVNFFFENRKGDLEDVKDVEAKLSSLRTRLYQLQKQFEEKWRECGGGSMDKAGDDREDELIERAKHLSELEELSYHFGKNLSPLLTSGTFPDPSLISSLQDQARTLVEKILSSGIQLLGNRSKSTAREHSLAKQLFLQEFSYSKADSGISESFAFMTTKLCDSLFGCCSEKKRPQMEELVAKLKEVEQTFVLDIQLREKQLYLMKAYTESFKGVDTRKRGEWSGKQKEAYELVSKALYQPYQDIITACENAGGSQSESGYVALCGVIEHVSESMNKGFGKVMTLLRNEAEDPGNKARPLDRYNKFMKKAQDGLADNYNRLVSLKKELQSSET